VSRDVTLYLEDMIEACRRVARYSEGLDRDGLAADTMVHDAVLRNLEILDEPAKGVPAEARAIDQEIAWRRIAGLRDVLAHAYLGIDEDIVWNVVSVEVPGLLPRLIVLRSALERKGE
jgi:uncharacterized protein with HEPN domain